ncbi:Aminotransferase class I and II [seawater metagenome]|uniref:Aminotransferase class I and II n=1 Tax=seawater metagenome TaxID=1561972 RepID=A0A5E8CHZ9_9ZZZZ
MKIGYQGIPGSYSEQALQEYLGDSYEFTPIKDFETVFDKITNYEIDMALIPIENSIGGSLHVNYDLLIKHNFFIVGEYNLPINHCLIANHGENLEDIKFITSHPQALIQCNQFIEKNNLKSQDFFDTAGSVKFINENKAKNVAAIASKEAAKIYNMKILQENIQDTNINYTRFILLSKTKQIKELDKFIKNKISIAFALKDNPGALANALTLFSSRSINISKIESRPNKTANSINIPYQYLFYLDIDGNMINKECEQAVKELENKSVYFRMLGNYASLNPHDKPNEKLIIGIIGFGRFGQFLAKYLNKQHYVIATSQSNHQDKAEELGVKFYKKMDDFIEQKMDVVILSMSILSFKDVIEAIPKQFFSNKLVVDVLSVKSYPKNILTNLNLQADILCTHPMFGPDSAKFSWKDLPFVYDKVKINDENRFNMFIDFFKSQGCKMINMTCEEHDNYSANSQFITHLTGRILEKVNIKSTPINTRGFNYLLEIMGDTCNDSFELFKGLYDNNVHSIATLDSFKGAIDTTIRDLNNLCNQNEVRKSIKMISNNNITTYADKLKENMNNNLLNLTIGEPDFQPIDIVKEEIINASKSGNYGYTKVEGKEQLLLQICEYLKEKKDITYTPDEIICSNGCKQSIFQILFYLCNEGDEVIVPTPAWSSYINTIKLIGATPIIIETKVEDNYQIDIDILKKSINSNTKAIILCNPHNPTGNIINKEHLEEIAKVIKETKIYVISDEIYELLDFYQGHISFASLEGMKDFTFTVNGISKGFALPGLRLGYTAGPKKHISKLKLIQGCITTCPSIISQETAIVALKNYKKYDHVIKEVEKVSNYLFNKIIKLPGFKCNYPLGGLYIFPDISYYFNKEIDGHKILNSSDFCEYLLKVHDVGASPGDIFNAPRNIRICFGSNMKIAEQLIYRLSKISTPNLEQSIYAV